MLKMIQEHQRYYFCSKVQMMNFTKFVRYKFSKTYMQFKEVLGQQQVKDKLIRSVKEERISHAQLFFGPPGTGKLPLAISYAQYICCTDPLEDDACGVCPSCVKFAKLAHPDLHFVFPVVNLKKAGSKTISDDYIERWRETIIENPYISENQWYEIMGAE